MVDLGTLSLILLGGMFVLLAIACRLVLLLPFWPLLHWS